MRRSHKSVLGVTLLEIMLVLAIAAMIIVMSIRYYQSASTNQKIAAGVDTVIGIIAAGESYLAANGSLTNFGAGGNAYMPGGTWPNSPWGGAITIAGAQNSYTITFPGPTGASCTQFITLLTSQNQKITGTCTSLTVTE